MEGFALDDRKTLLVGGTWDDGGGRPSSVLRDVASAFGDSPRFVFFNGGRYAKLNSVLDLVSLYSTVIWMPDVPNDKPKLVNEVKLRNPTAVLVTSKRNDGCRYSFPHLIARALKVRANLFVEIIKTDAPDAKFRARLFDPLGNRWIETADFYRLGAAIRNRVNELHGFTRVRSTSIGGHIETPDRPEFFALVRQYADTFHSLIHADAQDRFLGNVSFRCERGFPAFLSDDGLVFVSRRNVDKRHIDREHGFVAIDTEKSNLTSGVSYYGDVKPSVDAPIQVELFCRYPNIRYMLHSHVYFRGAPMTSRVIPCGALEEAREITDMFEEVGPTTFAAVNLLGHGSLIMTESVDNLRGLADAFMARPTPEIFEAVSADLTV